MRARSVSPRVSCRYVGLSYGAALLPDQARAGLTHAHSQYAAFLPYGDGRPYRREADAIENGPFDVAAKDK